MFGAIPLFIKEYMQILHIGELHTFYSILIESYVLIKQGASSAHLCTDPTKYFFESWFFNNMVYIYVYIFSDLFVLVVTVSLFIY